MPWITLVQHAGTTRTVSGPAAFSTYRSESEAEQPAQADVHFRMNSSLGRTAIVSGSCSRWRSRKTESRIYYYLQVMCQKSIIRALHRNVPESSAIHLQRNPVLHFVEIMFNPSNSTGLEPGIPPLPRKKTGQKISGQKKFRSSEKTLSNGSSGRCSPYHCFL